MNAQLDQVVIPMAGSGSRFVDAGYDVPKPLLPIHGVPMYEVVLANVMSQATKRIVIVARAEWNLGPRISSLAVSADRDIRLIEVETTTGGPAETVELAIPHLMRDTTVVIANSDQYVDADLEPFHRLSQSPGVDGAILAMEDDDPKWSYVAANPAGDATRVKEKDVISPFATVGIYSFATPEIMEAAFDAMRDADDRTNGEFYVAPSYNYLIRDAKRIAILNLGPIGSVMHGMGIPSDYEMFLQSDASLRAADVARTRLNSNSAVTDVTRS